MESEKQNLINLLDDLVEACEQNETDSLSFGQNYEQLRELIEKSENQELKEEFEKLFGKKSETEGAAFKVFKKKKGVEDDIKEVIQGCKALKRLILRFV